MCGLSITQLLVVGGSLLEADGVVLVVVGASNSYSLGLILGMEQNELVLVAFERARVGSDLGGVLVVDDAQFEGVPYADASCYGCNGSCA